MARATCAYINDRTKVRCYKRPKYLMVLQVHGEDATRLVVLCATCDKTIGRERLVAQGWTMQDTIVWERDPDHVPDHLLVYVKPPTLIQNPLLVASAQ
jgi:hypothetical protein